MIWIFQVVSFARQLVHSFFGSLVILDVIHESLHRAVEAESVRDLIIQVIGKHQAILFLERVHVCVLVPTREQLPFELAGLLVNRP